MNHNDVIEILNQGNQSDWLYDDDTGSYTYRQNLLLRMESKEIDHDRDIFQEDWATRHPDASAYKETYKVFYGSSLISRMELVSVDGHRATLPMPKSSTNVIPLNEYRFAQIVDQGGRLDEYIKRSQLVVES